jgi:hypothetical protein
MIVRITCPLDHEVGTVDIEPGSFIPEGYMQCQTCGAATIRMNKLTPLPPRKGWRRFIPWMTDEEIAHVAIARGFQIHTDKGWV